MLKSVQWFKSYILISLEVIESQQTVESTQYDVTIELASENYPKKTLQMLKSVH